MIITSQITKDTILEYKEFNDDSALAVENKRIFIKSNQDAWILPGFSKTLNVGLKIWIPKGHIGLIIKNILCVGPNLQLDTEIIYDDDELGSWVCITITNRGWLPVKIMRDSKLANLLIIPKTECHIVNTEGQS